MTSQNETDGKRSAPQAACGGHHQQTLAWLAAAFQAQVQADAVWLFLGKDGHFSRFDAVPGEPDPAGAAASGLARLVLQTGTDADANIKVLCLTCGEVAAHPELAKLGGGNAGAGGCRALLVAGGGTPEGTGVFLVALSRQGEGMDFTQNDAKNALVLGEGVAALVRGFEHSQQQEAARKHLVQLATERASEILALQASLDRATRISDEFLASMSHELRTPLNTIIGLSEAFQEGALGEVNPEQLNYLTLIEQSGRHLLALINDILVLSKIGAGKIQVKPETVVIEAVCKECLEFVKQPAHEKKIRVEYQRSPQVETLEADPDILKPMLINLLTNAVKFTPAPGRVGLEVHGDPEDQQVRFVVWDEGPGISAENLPRLFQPFAQLDGNLTRPHSSTGLGLSLVRRLAELHQGSLAAESTPAKGSRFTITLPRLTAPAVPPAAAPQAPQAPGPGAPDAPLLLLVEDNEAHIKTFSAYLHAKGFRVVVAQEGAEALRLAREQRPALVLMDIRLPGMDGLEVTRRLRREHEQAVAAVPVIALTALAMPGDRERCLEAGANEYLSKPVSLKALSAAIQNLLPNARARHPHPTASL